ncbi:hypothetical protein B2904_orf458 [Brachyspira pilosicoli B2904]|mgnify:CR=1 FL=1|uniref:TPR domain-containing protein n=1 Tax=Brachyspira pilosicoli B2904 TaxID=1133568 RepID=J9TRZ9_BRAPL|nr:hypothetical protein [Brachyspira pilosicoli]AFR69807.1 hypothetical protein B2904_orf458 [Brachyspira pilosicoli B2904]
MMRKIFTVLFLTLIFSFSAFSYSRDFNELYHLYYMANTNKADDLNKNIEKMKNANLPKVEKQTYDNLILLMDIYMNPRSKREAYKLLNDNIKKNTPLLTEKDADYMASVADVMSSAINYSSFNEVVKLSGKAGEIYDNALKINANHFPSLLGKAILTAYSPEFVGGGIDKSLPIFKKAESNAKEKWEKHIVYLWTSQAYFKNNDKANYEKYIKMAKDIFPEGAFIKNVVDMNAKGKGMFN